MHDPAAAVLPLDELLVHVLAQLPEEVRLELPGCDEVAVAAAQAHGIESRLDVDAGAPMMSGCPVEALIDGDATPAEVIDRLDPDASGHRVPRGDDGVFAGQRIVIVTNVPAPYRHGLFSRIQARMDAAGAEFRVLFARRADPDRPWVTAGDLQFRHEVMRSVQMPWGHRSPLLPRDLEARLRTIRPSVILHGGMSPLTAPRAALYARRTGAAFGIWSGELATAPTTRGRGPLRRWLLGRARFAVAYGTSAGAYLRQCGYRAPMVIGRNSSAFPSGVRDRPERPATVELITVGDLATRGKGIDVLLSALALRPDLPCRLTIIGGGALLETLRSRGAGDSRVTFTGALPHAEVQSRFLAADAYLTPTRLDRFGLALLEAMGAGLAPVMSTAPGLLADLGVHERNCLVVGDHDPRSWAAAIERVTLEHDLRRAMGDHARRTVHGRWSLDHAADSMIAGLRMGVAASRAR